MGKKPMTWSRHIDKSFHGHSGFPIVEILWEDAVAVALDWEEAVEHSSKKTSTVGYLIRESDDLVTVVSIINSSAIAHGISIPKGCISQIRYLSERNQSTS